MTEITLVEEPIAEAADEPVSTWREPREKLRMAFADSEFVLFGQSIVRLSGAKDRRPHFEVYVRLREEEKNMIPPGMFLPLIEEYDLGPQLDRYVVQKLLVRYSKIDAGQRGVAHLNLCISTLSDPTFASFVEEAIARTRVAGDCMVFEFPGGDSAMPEGARELAEGLKKAGCLISVGAVEDESVCFNPIRQLQADYLKLGGPLIRNIDDQAAAIEIRTAARACRAFNVLTIAQHVEEASTLTALRKLEIDLAQGYGISKPALLKITSGK